MRKLVLIFFVLTLISCSMGNDSTEENSGVINQFDGTWKRSENNYLVFSSSNFIYSYETSDQKGSFSGTFSYTSTTITFNPTEGWIWDKKYIPWTQNYRFVANRLDIDVLQAADGASYLIGGSYTKQ